MRLSYPIVHLDEIIGFRVPRDSHATRYRDARMQATNPVRCFAPPTLLAMLAAGAAHAPSFATVSCCLHPCARTRLLRAQLDAPDDGLDDDYLDRQVWSVAKRPPSPPGSPVPPSTNARARSQLSFASRGRIQNRRSSLFDRRFSLDEIGPPPRDRSPNPLSEVPTVA